MRKHEQTLPSKEADRVRHIKGLRAQTGPVFVAYRDSFAIDTIVFAAKQGEPIYDFVAQDGVRQRLEPDNHEIQKPLFGSHLLRAYPKAVVNIVESEKTAIVMAIAYGGSARQIWLACGSKNNITRERLRPLIDRKRHIVLYPDRDAVAEWEDIAQAIGYNRMTVNTDPVLRWWRDGDGEKADVADVVLRMIDGEADWQPKALGDLMKENPTIQTLVDNLNLEPL